MRTIVQPLASHGASILIPAEIVSAFKATGVKRIICTINQTKQLHVAIHARDGETFVMIGKQMAKDYGLIPGDDIEVTFAPDTTRYQMAVSEEFLEVLSTDYEGEQLFHRLTPGKQRSLLHSINTIKTSQTRIEKALRLMENLRSGSQDLKELLR